MEWILEKNYPFPKEYIIRFLDQLGEWVCLNTKYTLKDTNDMKLEINYTNKDKVEIEIFIKFKLYEQIIPKRYMRIATSESNYPLKYYVQNDWMIRLFDDLKDNMKF